MGVELVCANPTRPVVFLSPDTAPNPQRCGSEESAALKL